MLNDGRTPKMAGEFSPLSAVGIARDGAGYLYSVQKPVPDDI